jgi:hypothetical protein
MSPSRPAALFPALLAYSGASLSRQRRSCAPPFIGGHDQNVSKDVGTTPGGFVVKRIARQAVTGHAIGERRTRTPEEGSHLTAPHHQWRLKKTYAVRVGSRPNDRLLSSPEWLFF